MSTVIANWNKLPNKTTTRGWVASEFESFHISKSIKNVLLLPGENICCLSTILDSCIQKCIDISNITFHLVEENKKVSYLIKDSVSKNYPNYLKNCKFYNFNLSKFTSVEKIDFCWMDFLGNLTDDLFSWLNNWYYNNISDTNITYFTFQKAARGSLFMKKWEEFVCNDPEAANIIKKYSLGNEIHVDFYNIVCLLESLFLRNKIVSEYFSPAVYKDIKKGKKAAVDMLFFGFRLRRDDSFKFDNLMDGFFGSLKSKPIVVSPVSPTPSVVSAPKNLAGIKAHYTRLIKKATLTSAETIRLEGYKKVLGIV